jgi:hypothetical protein
LEEFLAPAFAFGGGAAGDDAWHVELIEDARCTAEVFDRGPQVGAAPVACFALERGFVFLPSWNGPPSVRTVVDEQARVAVEVDSGRRHVRVLTLPDRSGVRTVLMRVVRELAMHHVRKRGGLLLHGAALAVGGRGLLILGDKGAGKTTLLIHLLRRAGAQYLSNDRVVVWHAGARPRLRGMPTIVSIRSGTVGMFPQLRARLERRVPHYRLTLEEAAATTQQTEPVHDGRFGVSAAQLCALLGVQRIGTCAGGALVFPRIVPGEQGMRFVQIPRVEVAARLRRSVFGVPAPANRQERLFDDGHWGTESEAMRVTHLATSLPALECRLGDDAYADAAHGAEVAGWLAG